MNFTSGDFREQRLKMVDNQLQARDISDERVLEAFRRVPREEFVRPGDRPRAYEDRALPTASGQTISQPYMVAAMTQFLNVLPGHKVLEVGTGSGYQTAILSRMDVQLYTIETHEELLNEAKKTLERLGYTENLHFRVGDGTLGWPEEAPFDRILVTAGAPETPRPLLEQTAVGGRIVIPIGSRTGQDIHILDRVGPDEWERETTLACVFVPLVGAEGWKEGE